MIDSNLDQFRKNKAVQNTLTTQKGKQEQILLNLDKVANIDSENNHDTINIDTQLKHAKNERFFEINSNNHQKSSNGKS